MKILKKFFSFIKYHPVWTVLIICLILCFANGYKTGEYNFYGYWFLALVILGILAPFIRNTRRKKERKEEMDYLAKKIAEEAQYLKPSIDLDTTNTEKNDLSDSELELIEELIKEKPQAENSEFIGKYQKRYLLTKNEYSQYKKLKLYADRNNLLICPKVRLLDLIEPRRGDPKYKTFFYKIQAKHVDFVICDHNLYVKAILEIDDSSHDQEARKDRDNFVDSILKDVGYTVIRTRYITDDTFNTLEQVLSKQDSIQ